MSLPPLKELQPPFLKVCGKLIKDNILINPDSKLHEDQQRALLRITVWFGHTTETKKLISVVVMPTGTGKTGVICCLPYMFGWAVEERKFEHDLTKPILVLAPGLTILRQLEQNMCYDPNNDEPFLIKRKLFGKDQGEYIYNTLVVNSTDAVTKLHTTESKYQVVLSNVQKWRKKKEIPNYELLKPDLFSAVIVDEAHHLPAKQWQKIIDQFKQAKVIFFTATPFRSDGKEITSDRAISKDKDFTFVLERSEAIKKKLIREIDFDDQIVCEDPSECKDNEWCAGCTTKVLNKIKLKLAEKNLVSPLPGEIKHQAIVITKSKYEADLVEGICDELHWRSVKVHSGSAREATEEEGTKPKGKLIKDTKELIKEIHSNKFELLIVVEMLLEGFDHPPLSVAGILTNIHSQVKFAQFVGRVQRLVRSPWVESNITANIITAKKFNQNKLYEKYKEPTLPDELEEDDD